MKKFILGTLVTIGVLVGVAAWILGDSFGPVSRLLKGEAKNKLESLVDQSKLDHAKAEEAVAQARVRAGEIQSIMAATNAHIANLEQDIAKAQLEIDRSRQTLMTIEARLMENKPIATQSGRILGEDEIRIRVQDHGQTIALAEEKINLFNGLLKNHQERRAYLAEVAKQVPIELAKLELSVKHLAEKVKMYEHYQARIKEDKNAGLANGAWLSDAQQTLETAHAEIDTRLAEFDAKMKLVNDNKPMKAPADHKNTLEDIRRILANDALAEK